MYSLSIIHMEKTNEWLAAITYFAIDDINMFTPKFYFQMTTHCFF